MNPVEAAIRAACKALGADPETWRGFEAVGREAIDGFLKALPPEIEATIRTILERH